MTQQAMAVVQSSDRRRTAAAWFALLVAGGVVAVTATTVSGQQPQYEVRELDAALLDERTVKRMKASFRTLALARDLSRVSAQDRQIAGAYLTRFIPARITQPDAVGEIGELVMGTVDDLRKAQMSGSPAAQGIASALFNEMKTVAEGNFQPPARVAATLALGQLDAAAATNDRPPQPVPQVLPILVKLYQNEDNDEGVRAAALQGIHRHVRFRRGSIPQAEQVAIVESMSSLLDESLPPRRSPQAHAYLQRFAVDILGIFKGDKDQEFASKLVSISTSKNRDDLIALYSAARAGQMKEALSGAVETPALVLDQWSARVYKAFKSELERLEKLSPPQAASGQPPAPRDVLRPAEEATKSTAAGGGYGDEYGDGMDDMSDYGGGDEDMMDGYDGGGYGGPVEANPQPPEVIASRRQLNYVLQQLQLAVTGSPTPGLPRAAGGLLAAVDPAEKAVVETWVARMEEVITSINDKLLDDRDKFMAGIEAQLGTLEELAGDQLAEPAPEAVEAEAAAENLTEAEAVEGAAADQIAGN